MTLLGKKKEDNRIAAILAHLNIANQNLELLIDLQRATIKAIDKQTDRYGDFINVIQNFFAIQKKLSLDEVRRKAEIEAEFDLTEADKKY